jgi:propionate CoA-transferase
MSRTRIVTADEAVLAIPNGCTLALGGSGHLLQVPESLLLALQRRFAAQGDPRDLVVVHSMGLGDNEEAGLERLGAPGLVRRFIGSHFAHSPTLMRRIGAGDVEAFGLPGGVISLLYREIAGGRPGLVTRTGLGTYVDPRVEGGRLNDVTEGSLVEVIELAGEEWLFYRSFPLHVGLIRATTADVDGNLTMEDEAGLADNLALASAVHNSGGTVIAEVKHLAARGSLRPTDVRVPGILVDLVVQAPHQRQTGATDYSPYRSGRLRAPSTTLEPLPEGPRKIVARRAARELRAGDVVNLGFGMSTGIASVLREHDLYDAVVFSIEQGIIGGVPGTGLDSGTAVNAQAFIDEGAQFDLYDGGSLDLCSVSFGEVDVRGDVNVSRLGGEAVGPGGFINITQNARRLLFCGTFSGGGLRTSVSDGRLSIDQEGRYPKFVDRVGQITFSAGRALQKDLSVTYITERAVFRMTKAGMELIEHAPGVDVERDILAMMAFEPLVSPDLRLMDAGVMGAGPFELPLLSDGSD